MKNRTFVLDTSLYEISLSNLHETNCIYRRGIGVGAFLISMQFLIPITRKKKDCTLVS